MQILEVIRYIEEIAPLSLQESYDNSGIICGNIASEIKSVLITLDLTEEVLIEAKNYGVNLIISHHPLIFGGLKSVTGKNTVERILIEAIKNDIAIYAAHTNFDNIQNGVNSRICQKIGLTNLRILDPIKGQLYKLIAFIPEGHIERIRTALFNAGAGHIGNYDNCSFNVDGVGTFRGLEGTNPFLGEIGKLSTEKETRFETIVTKQSIKKVIEALLEAHPYEEVAYDIYPLENDFALAGAGMIGNLQEPEDAKKFLERIKTVFGCNYIRHTKLVHKKVEKVAVCGGSGSFLITKALQAQADIFITGDMKYHQFFEAEGKIILVDIGHFESEQFTKEIFYEILMKKFTTFAIHLSKVNTNPINYL